MVVFGVLRDPKGGTFGGRNFSKRLVLQSVGGGERVDAVSYCFGHFGAVFLILAVFGAVFGSWTPQRNGTSRTRKLGLGPLWGSTFEGWRWQGGLEFWFWALWGARGAFFWFWYRWSGLQCGREKG